MRCGPIFTILTLTVAIADEPKLQTWRTTDGHESKAIFHSLDKEAGTVTLLVPKTLPLDRLDAASQDLAVPTEKQVLEVPQKLNNTECKLLRLDNIGGAILKLLLLNYTINGRELTKNGLTEVSVGTSHLESPKGESPTFAFRLSQIAKKPDPISYSGWCFMEGTYDGKPTDKSINDAWTWLTMMLPDLNRRDVLRALILPLSNNGPGAESYDVPATEIDVNLWVKGRVIAFPADDEGPANHRITLCFAQGPFFLNE